MKIYNAFIYKDDPIMCLDQNGEYVKHSEAKGIIKEKDKEIHRLEQIAIENSDWFDALKIDFDKQKEEIKKLSEKNEYLENVLEVIAKYQYQTASKDALLLSGWAEQALETKK